jgi:hypothetical protein
MSRHHAPLSRQLDEQLSELQVQRIWSKVQAPVEPLWKHKHLPLLAAACGLAFGVVTGILTLRPSAPLSVRTTTPPTYVGTRLTRLTAEQATQLMHEADRAQQHGDVLRAVTALERVRRGASGTAQAALAGWTLARLRMASDPAHAALDIQRALQDELPDDLQETVRARLVEAHALAGSSAAARAAAHTYRAAYPAGRYLEDIERWTRAAHEP